VVKAIAVPVVFYLFSRKSPHGVELVGISLEAKRSQFQCAVFNHVQLAVGGGLN
jgi:hypothetical protein